MFVSEYIIKLLANYGVDTVFGITGTAVNMLFVSIERTEGISYVCPLHEQSASMAADGYSRVTGKVGVCIATSGPGATNLITGVTGAYTESIPMLVIVGQASTTIQKKNSNIRYYGFQEFDTVDTFKSFTKYTKEITDASDIEYELAKALHIANSGRKGPVVLSIPEDVLYAEAVVTDKEYRFDDECKAVSNDAYDICYDLLSKARKPVLLLGGGVHCSNAEKQALNLIEKIKCPVLLTYPARDLLPDNHYCNAGSIGIFGSRSGNNALCSADLIIGVGCRFDGYAIGEAKYFAENAKVVAVDIDENELSKYSEFGIKNDLAINQDAKMFFENFASVLENNNYDYKINEQWCDEINKLKEKYPLVQQEYYDEDTTSPYVLVECLSDILDDGANIFVDTGLSSTWLGQSFKFKNNQRMMSQFGFSAMGYSLPAAIGACIAKPNEKVICFIGDGSLQMNIQELATAMQYNLNLAIIVICNNGYGLIQKTQDDFNNGHAATDPDHGVGLPNISKIADAYGLDVFEINTNEQITSVLKQMMATTKPTLCSAYIDIKKRIVPRKKGRGPLCEMFPSVD